MRGVRGPEGNWNRTVTVSVAVPGLNTSISEEPPGTSCAWGIAQCDCGAITPGTSERPPDVPPGPTSSCTSAATTRPVRVATTVLMVATCCTSAVTFSAVTWPAGSTIPW